MTNYPALVCIAFPFDCRRLPVEPDPEREAFTRLALLVQAIGCLRALNGGESALHVLLAPERFFSHGGQPYTGAVYERLLAAMIEIFRSAEYRHWLIQPGTLHYRRDLLRFIAAPLFHGASEHLTLVLKQNFAAADGSNKEANGAHIQRRLPRIAHCHPAKRCEDLVGALGLRIGLEIGHDHERAELAGGMNRFAAKLDLHLVPPFGPCAAAEGGFAALREGGLLFRCDGAGGGASLVRHHAAAAGEPQLPTRVLTAAGKLWRYPAVALPGQIAPVPALATVGGGHE